MAIKYKKQRKRPPQPVIDIQEARRGTRGSNKGAQSLSMAWDDTYLGVPGTEMRSGLLSERDRKDTYYKAFLSNCWISGCVEAISKRITSGGWTVVEVEQGKGNEANRDELMQFLRFEGQEFDFVQFLRSVAVDILIYGEAYVEIVWAGGKPVELHKIDCCTMTCHFDKHGCITGYTQELDRSVETVEFTPDQIIRWWLPDPRAGQRPLSPLEKLKDPVYLAQAMTTWAEKFFKQGSRPAYWVELGEDSDDDSARRFIKFYRENYTGLTNAHNPPVMYNGAKINEFSKGSIELDFDVGLQRQRDQILLGFGLTPAMLGIIESGNIGGGTGESQNKTFLYNTVEPLNQMIMEKFNYRVTHKGFQIEDWVIRTKQADYRDSGDIGKLNDLEIRNGSLTINEARQEHGRVAVPGGDEAVIATSREITPIARLSALSDEQAQAAKLANEMQVAQIEKVKQSESQPANSNQKPADEEDEQDKANTGIQGLPNEKESFTDWLALPLLETEEEDDEVSTDKEELAKSIAALFGEIERRGHQAVALGD